MTNKGLLFKLAEENYEQFGGENLIMGTHILKKDKELAIVQTQDNVYFFITTNFTLRVSVEVIIDDPQKETGRWYKEYTVDEISTHYWEGDTDTRLKECLNFLLKIMNNQNYE